MELFKKISTQTTWQVLGKVITSLSTILTLSLITREYGAVGVGNYTLVLTYLGFFYLSSDLGLNAYLLPHILEDRSLAWRKLLGLRLVWSTVLICIGVSIHKLLPFNSELFSQMLYFGILTVLFYAIYQTAVVYFQAKLRYDLVSLILGINSLILLAGSFILVTSHFSLQTLILIYLLAWLITALTVLWWVKSKFQQIKPILDLAFIKNTIYRVWPLSLTLVLNTIYFRADTFILASFKPLSEVGIYNLSYQLFQSILVLPTFITNAYYPLMLVDWKKSLLKVILAMAGLSVLGAVATWLLSPLVINLITGNRDFAGSVLSLRILALSLPAFFISSVLMWLLISLKKQKIVLCIYTSALILNIVLNYLFIPEYSYLAASWITGLCEYLILVMEVGVLVRYLRV